MREVSAPSRGAIFLNKTFLSNNIKLSVSVPSRGAIFLNKKRGLPNARYVYVFPSPLGELYFLIGNSCGYYAEKTLVSVPSRGAIFLNTISWTPLVFWGYLPFCVANCFFWKYSFLWNEFLQVFPVFMWCVGNACKIPGFLLL